MSTTEQTTNPTEDVASTEQTDAPPAPATETNAAWAENESDDEDDDDVAPGRENKKRGRPEGNVKDGQNKSARTSADETEDGEEGEEGTIVTITISVESNLAGCVIGRGGTVIKSTREQSGANVNVSKEEVAPGLREVTITGQAHQVAAAKELVTAQVDAKKQQQEESGESSGPPPGQTTTIMQVPNAKVGGLIGKGGSSINDIRNRSGCRINIQDSRQGGAQQRDVTIIGTLEQAQEAQRLIAAKLLEIIPRESNSNGGGRGGQGGMYGGQGGQYGAPPGYGGQRMQYGGMAQQAWGNQGGMGGPPITTQVSVPDDSVGRLIGRGGETINRIRQMSQCRIDIAKSDAQSQSNGLRIITLSGTEQTIKIAQDMLRQKLAEAQQQQNSNYNNNSSGGQQGGGQNGQQQGQDGGANPWGAIGQGGQGYQQQQGYQMGGFSGNGYGMMPPGGQQQYGGAQGGGAGGAQGGAGGNPY